MRDQEHAAKIKDAAAELARLADAACSAGLNVEISVKSYGSCFGMGPRTQFDWRGEAHVQRITWL